MAYNNNGRGGYNGGNRGGQNNNRGGQYRQNGGGNGNYQNNGGGYRNNGGGGQQDGGQNEKRFGAGFRMRGIVCKSKDGGPVQIIDTRNGGFFVNVSVMVSKFSNSGNRDQNGKTIWNENNEYFRLVAFGKVAEQLANDLVLRANVEFIGTIGLAKEYNGRRDVQLVVNSYTIKSLPNNNGGGGGNRGGQNNGGGYQSRNNGGNGGGYQGDGYGGGEGGYGDDGYGAPGGVNYDDRPNNGGQNYRQNPQPQPPHNPEPEHGPGPGNGDFAAGDDDGPEDIPF